jgi:hypothetical protein
MRLGVSVSFTEVVETSLIFSLGNLEVYGTPQSTEAFVPLSPSSTHTDAGNVTICKTRSWLILSSHFIIVSFPRK